MSLFCLPEGEARLAIRNTLDGLLTKTHLLSKSVFPGLIKYLEENSNTSPDDNLLEEHLYDAYYSRFSTEAREYVFREFWKFLFRLKEEECERNRAINYRAFFALFNSNPSTFIAQIKNDAGYFSQVAPTGSPVMYLIRFLAHQPDIYKLLGPQANLAIGNTIEANSLARCIAYFTAKSLNQHADKLEHWIRKENLEIENSTWNELQSLSNSSEWAKKVTYLRKLSAHK